MSIGLRMAAPRARWRGLLNRFPGAAAAYSLRALREETLSSPVIRVRRSSDDAESDFTAAQLTDGTLTTWTGAGDGFVRTWYDQSGNARHAVQTTPENQPQIVAGGVLVTDGGKGAILWDGVNDTMSAGTYTQSAPATIFDINYFRENNRRAILSDGNSTRTIHGNNNQTVLNAGLNLTSVADTLPLNAYYLRTDLINGANSSTHVNGNSVASGNAGANGFSGPLLLSGGSFLYKGRRRELIIYASNQSSNRAAIEANINAAWEIY